MDANKLQDFESFEKSIDDAVNMYGGGSGGVMRIASEARRLVAAMMCTAAEKSVCNTKSLLKVRTEADRFESCGTEHRVYRCAKCNHQYKAKSSCNSRICPECSRRYGLKVSRRLRDDLRPFWSSRRKNTYGPKFLTLTFKRRYTSDVPGPDDLKRCQYEVRQFLTRFYSKYAARKSRNGHWYADRRKPRGAGAVAVPEIGERGTLHFHVLAYGPYIPHAKLVQAWIEITGDSRRVEVQDGGKLNDGCAYVTKYLSKPPAKALSSWALLAQWALTLKGSRRMAMYGAMYGKFKCDRQSRTFRMRCLYCGTDLEFVGLGVDSENVLIDIEHVHALFNNDRDGPSENGWCPDPILWRDFNQDSLDRRYELKPYWEYRDGD